MHEDIFSVNDPTEHPKRLVIRYNDRAQTKFDNANKVRFEDIIRVLSDGTWPCYLSKRTQDEILISVPMTNPAGQADLVLTYNQIKFSYELLVAHAKKTKFRSSISLPEPQSPLHCQIYLFDSGRVLRRFSGNQRNGRSKPKGQRIGRSAWNVH